MKGGRHATAEADILSRAIITAAVIGCYKRNTPYQLIMEKVDQLWAACVATQPDHIKLVVNI
jgi:hypothetical protein